MVKIFNRSNMLKGYFFAFSALWAYPAMRFVRVKLAEQQGSVDAASHFDSFIFCERCPTCP